MYKRRFDFEGGSLTVENENRTLKVAVTDATGDHAVNVPKTHGLAVVQSISAGVSETQALTQAQIDAISDRGEVKDGKQPF